MSIYLKVIYFYDSRQPPTTTTTMYFIITKFTVKAIILILTIGPPLSKIYELKVPILKEM
jgi:hypothetical protein